MRIAFSGAHAAGKTTLIAELRNQLARHEAVEESYYALLEEGHQFADTPSAEDFEVQLARSIAETRERRDNNVLFDRSPVDYLAYLYALRGSSGTDMDTWLQPTVEALGSLDLIVFVPVERPDRISDPEFPRLRRRVDSILRDIWMEDGWGFGANAVAVTGPVSDRTSQVLAHLRCMVAADKRLQRTPGRP